MDIDRKGRFLDAYPHLLDDIQDIDRTLGRTPRPNWTEFDQLLQDLLRKRGAKWEALEKKEFRNVFTETNPDAEPVVKEERQAAIDLEPIWGWFPHPSKARWVAMYEADTSLRDFENIALKDDVSNYVRLEVISHVADAWADRNSVRPAYEINFNRYFYTFKQPRPLEEIDRDIQQLEDDVIRLLREVTR